MTDVHKSETHERIDRWVEEHKSELLGTIAQLIRIPTENHPPGGDELVGQLYLKGLMEGMGAETDLFELSEVPNLTSHPVYMEGRNYEGRPNLVGRFKGSGGGRSLLFSSHMDTAPRQPLPWHESEPFSGEVKGERLYGRGSYDMKGALISSLFAARAVCELGVALRGDVLIESVVDEEWGGSNGTLAARLRGYEADAAVIPEPSHMAICPTHLGVRLYRLTIEGQAGMRFGGEKFGNAVVAMANIVQTFPELAKAWQSRPLPELYRGGNPPPVDIMGIRADGYGVPGSCSLDFCVHCFDGVSRDELDGLVAAWVRELSQRDDLKGANLRFEPTSRYVEPSSIPADHPIVSCAQKAFSDIEGREAVVQGAPFACDAYVFNRYSSTPAVILGPAGARAHGPDEYALVEDLVDLVRIYARMIIDWCA